MSTHQAGEYTLYQLTKVIHPHFTHMVMRSLYNAPAASDRLGNARQPL
jgi:hypothetical protein